MYIRPLPASLTNLKPEALEAALQRLAFQVSRGREGVLGSEFFEVIAF